MDYEDLLTEILQFNRETEWIEFKINNINPQEIGEYISALSNSASYHQKTLGFLVFGVEDETLDIVGTTFQPFKEKVGNQELENWLATQLNPAIDFKIIEFEKDEKKIVIFRIDATPNQPVLFRNKAFIRIGSYKKSLDDHPERERKIWTKAISNDFEYEIAMADVSAEKVIHLLNFVAYFDMMKIPLPETNTGVLEKFVQERLIQKRKDGNYDILNLGALLFAKDFNDFSKIRRKALRVIVYDGNNKYKTKKEKVFEKGYASGFYEIIDYINGQLPSYEEIGVAFRKQVIFYPPIAIREFVANALIHQDFMVSGTSPMVEIFDNKVEITNWGKSLVPTERFIDHPPISRNEILAGIMRRLEICEERGSGIDKAIIDCELYHSTAPLFETEENFTRVILKKPHTYKEMDKQDKIRACYQHCCLKYVLGEYMTNQSLRERLEVEDKNYPMISKLIADTIEAKLIKAYNEDNKANRHNRYIPNWNRV